MSDTAPLVTASRDALARGLASTWIDSPIGRLLVGAEFGRETCATIADALLASGVVRAVDGLAEDEAPTPEQAERDRAEASPGDTYPDGRPKMHRHSMGFDVHRDDECDRGVLPDGSWTTSRRRVYVFDDDVLDAHERHIAARALAAALATPTDPSEA